MAVPSNAATGTVLGRLRMKYRCHFFSPQLQDLNSGAQIAATFPSLLNSGPDNLMRVLNAFGAVVTGNPQYQVKLDSLGQGFIELAQGVYKLTGNLNAPGGEAGIQAPGMGSDPSTFDPPTITLNAEPASAAAPQPWSAQVLDNKEWGVENDAFNSVTSSYFVGIPRDGAKVMWPWTITADVINTNDFGVQLDVERIGNFIPQFSGLFLAKWEGVTECHIPKLFMKEAQARALLKFPKHPLVLAVLAPKKKVDAGVAACKIDDEAKRRFPLARAAIDAARAREEVRLTSRDVVNDLAKAGVVGNRVVLPMPSTGL